MRTKLDVAPGWKTYVTAFLTAAFNLVAAFGGFELSPELVEAINAIAVAALATFLGLKVERNA